MTEKEIKSILGVAICNEISPALARSLVWGAAGAASTALTQDKAKSKEERKKNLRNMGIMGALSLGAAGASELIKNKD